MVNMWKSFSDLFRERSKEDNAEQETPEVSKGPAQRLPMPKIANI